MITSDEIKQRIRELWVMGDGTAADVAAEVNAQFGAQLTRNAVIGHVHRMGLSNYDRPRPPTTDGASSPAPVAKKVARKPKAVPVEYRAPALEIVKIDRAPIEQVEAVIGGVDLFPAGPASLPFTACRWPLWKSEPNGRVCGATCKDGKPYCADHCKIAYLPPAERKPGEKKRAAA